MVRQHGPGEAQHPPPVLDQLVLPPTVVLEHHRVVLVQAAVDLQGQLDRVEGDIKVVEPAVQPRRGV
ncbi:MAG: hypothetical protein AVDCRST_MAG75-20 [uncultured Propionibacteriaceae bacterium]|uniref:Uncharacterized protein n=1 Tax=uncultured Propionibacteriaceae bacterium TaxID=257457 RepID=A0A6J4MWE3_9ACTN|nr:MAG: hypothetical protein AVDCRST_MAG75-20 [uncultured Propionibacteriaceae bacterium]